MYNVYSEEEKKSGTYDFEKICCPPIDKRRKDSNYAMLDINGVIKKGSYVEKGDVLIGKTFTHSTKDGEEEVTDCSLIVKKGEEGQVDRIFESITPNGYRLVKIVIRSKKTLEVGDKCASTIAQKGTIGMVYRQEDMPFTASGIVPDLIINAHCLSGDTVIELGDGDVSYIKDIYNKNNIEINTVNPNTLEKSITKFENGFVKNTEKMLEITTTSGRILKCTPEHLWLVVRNNNLEWIKSQDLIQYSDKLIVTHSILPIDNNNETNLNIIPENNGIYWKKIKENGLIGKIHHNKLKILARLLGAIDSDGHLQIRNEKIGLVRCILHLGEIEDYNEVCRDVEILGFKKPTCLKTAHCFRVELEVALGVLLRYLGACCGNKTKAERKFPEWLKIESLSIKREFLSGYNGGDGCKVSVNYKKPQQQVYIHGTRCRSYIDVRESHIEYLKSIMEMYNELGIKVTLQEYKAEYPDRTDLMIAFSQSMSNILKVSELIGYRYCNHKRRESVIGIEFLKSKLNGFCIKFENFKNCFTYMDNVTTFIQSIKEIEPELVYDFTTISKNHSFIANGIVSHNCIPSRMTISQLLECVLGKSCAIKGKFGDSTAFTSSSIDIADKLCDELSKTGFERHGTEILYSGFTGEELESRIFIGPTYYQRLKHLVSEKMHARARGPVTTMLRQPLQGTFIGQPLSIIRQPLNYYLKRKTCYYKNATTRRI